MTVASTGVLTIWSGVVVKFEAGLNRRISVAGVLDARGTAAEPITFTSLKDDTVGGDDGQDGPTQGTPGDWWELRIGGDNKVSRLSYVNVKYGGYGTSDTLYGAVHVAEDATVQIYKSSITSSQRSGVHLDLGSTAIVASSIINGNGGNGITAYGFVDLRSGSMVSQNSRDGVAVMLGSSYAGPRSTITDSEIYGNGRYGVYTLAPPVQVPDSEFPTASRSNIYGNTSSQLYSYYERFAADWKNNYWGSTVQFYSNPPACSGVGKNSPGKLAYTPLSGNPPAGPIFGSYYLVGATKCAYDNVRIGATEFATTPFNIAAGAYGSGISTAYYSFEDDECTDPVDPISLIFYGHGSPEPIQDHLAYHASWEDAVRFGDQYFISGEACSAHEWEMATIGNGLGVDRAHLRARETYYNDPVLGATSVTTPHEEVWDGSCFPPSHAVREGGPNTGYLGGFVIARENLELIFTSSEHVWYEEYVGNTDTQGQCNGWLAANDGWIAFVYIPSSSH